MAARAQNAAATRPTSAVPTNNSSGDEEPPPLNAEQQKLVNGRVAAQRENTVTALRTLMNDDSRFQPNPLGALYQPMYHWRLFMTNQHELLKDTAGTTSIKEALSALDALPSVTIAETGVTAGFNIREVTIEEQVTPGFQNRNTMITEISIQITEPGGASLIEAIAKSARALQVQNYSTYWYYLECSFLGYDEDGTVNLDPLKNENYPNGGRWVWQVQIVNSEIHMNELGATYTLKCLPFELCALNDQDVGVTPDNLRIVGKTMGEILKSFGEELTKAYTDRYLGEIYKFEFKNQPIEGKDANVDDFRLSLSEFDPKNIVDLELDAQQGADGVMSAQIPRGTRVNDVIEWLWVHCEDAQKLMLDTKSPQEVEDGKKGTWNGKNYRESVVPRVEPVVKVTGWDPVTGLYKKDIAYRIHGFTTTVPNLTPNQYFLAKEEQTVDQIVSSLKSKGYLNKRYDYRYTGMNTEVLRFDLDFNFNFTVTLPRMNGWRADIRSQTDYDRKRDPNAKEEGRADGEIAVDQNGGATPVDVAQGGSTAAPTSTSNSTTPTFNQTDAVAANRELQDLNAKIEEVRAKLEPASGVSNLTPQETRELRSQLAAYQQQKSQLMGRVSSLRTNFQKNYDLNIQNLEKTWGKDPRYSEELVREKSVSPYTITYRHATDDGSQRAQGVGVQGHWHRGSSLVGALLNQLYEPNINALARINLEIKGDPYWLGTSNLERRSAGAPPAREENPMANYMLGDNTFVLCFRQPYTVDENTGVPLIRNDDIFNGVYRVTRVKSLFAAGKFTQTLEATRLELVALPVNDETDDVQVNYGQSK